MNAPLVYERPDEIALDAIPVIDFAPFRDGDAAARAKTAALIGHACREVGFFYLANHGVPESLRQRVLAESRAFFARTRAEKMHCAPLLDGQWCGYMPSRGAAEGTRPGASLTEEGRASTSVSGGTLEQFTMMRVIPADDPNFESDDPVYQANRWPAGQPGFVEAMMLNQRALLALGEELERAFAIALGLDEEHFVALHRSPLAAFGLNYYPAPSGDATASDVGVGAHADASSFTVLLQDDVGGLEVKLRDGRWISAPPLPGAYVINIGDTMMGWTNGTFVSTHHRVVSRQRVDRYSATMFMNPGRDVLVEPIEAFVSAERPSLYKPFLNGDYMRSYYVKFYDSMFK